MDTVWTRAGRRLAPVVAVVVLVAAGSAVLVPAPSGAAVIRPAWAAWGQARPAPPSAPRTLPFQPTGALHSAVAGPVSPADLISSSNWSGQVESGGLYSAVSAAWKVPAVGTTNQDEYSGAWIGIDGYGSSTLLQTGTAQESTPSGPQYYAWYEVYPAPAEYLGPVAAGDQMAASISEDSPGTWNLSISDLTSAQGASGPITYDGPASSAEWIAEAPSLGGALTTLAPFGSVTFANLGLTYTGTSFGHTIVMVNLGAESVEAYPQPIDQAADDFTIVQGVPPVPTVTLVTPAVGTTDGGNTVAIGGTGFSTELVVLFGGQPAASVLLDSDTSLVATPPPQLAGPVSVTVETLGGTSAPTGAATYTYSTDPPVIPHGYWLVGADGGIFTFGTAKFHGSTGNLVLNRPVVGITVSPDHGGYRLVASDGGLFAFGDSRYYGSIPGLGIGPAGSPGPGRSLNAPIVAMVPSADGAGYFMVAADGGVFAFGDAKFSGSCPSIGGCEGAAVAVMPDASGHGYWLVTAVGAVYAFGDARFLGGVTQAPAPVVAAVRTPDGAGYWILLSDGEVDAFGDAVDYGQPDASQVSPANPATAIFATSDGGGYWVTTANGAVIPFGDAPQDGGMSTHTLNAPIVAAAGW